MIFVGWFSELLKKRFLINFLFSRQLEDFLMDKKPTYEELEQRVKKAEEVLRKSETFSFSLLDNSPNPILVINPDTSVKYVNPSLEKLTGFSHSEIIGRKAPYPWWTEETLEKTGKDLERAMHERAQRLEELFQKKNGERFWVEITSVPIRENGELKYYIANWIDITERKQVEEKLSRALKERENIMETVPDIIYVLDMNGKLIRWNSKLKVFTGLSPEELMGRDALEFFEEDKEIVAEAIREVFEKGQIEVEACIIRKDGTPVPYYWTGALLKDEQGNVIGITGVGRDITEHKQAEQALRESEKRYRTLLETTSEEYWIVDPELKIIEVNQAICNMLGYSEKEILGKTPLDFVDDKNRKIFIEQSSKIPTTSYRSFEIVLKKKNGEDLYTYFNASTLRDESGDIQGAFAFIIDITERKQAQEERDRLSTAIEQAAESVFITDRDGIIQYINPAFERLTGYSRKDAIGQNPRILKSGKHDALFYKKMWDTITRGDAWHGRLINKKKDGSLYEAVATISPVSDTSGKIINFVSIKRDITHEIELEKQLIQSQKMEAIGTLAGGIAHDFNNILAAIMGCAELALIDVPKETRLYDDVQKILNAGYRAKGLVQQILTFSRKSEEEKAPVQIRHLVKEALKFVRSSLPAIIEIHEEIAGEIGIVNANPTQMHQVIMNLCTNASHAMPEGGILEIGLRNVDFDSHYAARYPDIDPGKYLRLTVSDTGEGMTSEVMDRIFEPYFTTKEKGVGTGMGLSVVHGIVKSHGGTVTVYSKPGKGSTFHVYIPLIKEGVKRPEIDEDTVIPTGNERILFIDDEPALVDLGKRMFEQLGYEVTSRTSSVEALELFKARPDRFDLVITDMTMPNIMGDKLAHELMKIRPDIPIILCTGYSEKITEEKAKK
jgi:PAS domain S-box-containing protein